MIACNLWAARRSERAWSETTGHDGLRDVHEAFFLLSAQDRTLSSEDISGFRQRIIEGMQAAGYELRV